MTVATKSRKRNSSVKKTSKSHIVVVSNPEKDYAKFEAGKLYYGTFYYQTEQEDLDSPVLYKVIENTSKTVKIVRYNENENKCEGEVLTRKISLVKTQDLLHGTVLSETCKNIAYGGILRAINIYEESTADAEKTESDKSDAVKNEWVEEANEVPPYEEPKRTVNVKNTSKGCTVMAWDYDEGRPIIIAECSEHVLGIDDNDEVDEIPEIQETNENSLEECIKSGQKIYAEIKEAFFTDSKPRKILPSEIPTEIKDYPLDNEQLCRVIDYAKSYYGSSIDGEAGKRDFYRGVFDFILFIDNNMPLYIHQATFDALKGMAALIGYPAYCVLKGYRRREWTRNELIKMVSECIDNPSRIEDIKKKISNAYKARKLAKENKKAQKTKKEEQFIKSWNAFIRSNDSALRRAIITKFDLRFLKKIAEDECIPMSKKLSKEDYANELLKVLENRIEQLDDGGQIFIRGYFGLPTAIDTQLSRARQEMRENSEIPALPERAAGKVEAPALPAKIEQPETTKEIQTVKFEVGKFYLCYVAGSVDESYKFEGMCGGGKKPLSMGYFSDTFNRWYRKKIKTEFDEKNNIYVECTADFTEPGSPFICSGIRADREAPARQTIKLFEKEKKQQTPTPDAEIIEAQIVEQPKPEEVKQPVKSPETPEFMPCPICGSTHKPFLKKCDTNNFSMARGRFANGGLAYQRKYYRLKCRDCGHEVQCTFFKLGEKAFFTQEQAKAEVYITWNEESKKAQEQTKPLALPAKVEEKPTQTPEPEPAKSVRKTTEEKSRTATKKAGKSKVLTVEAVTSCATVEELYSLFMQFKKSDIEAFAPSLKICLRGIKGLNNKEKLAHYCAKKYFMLKDLLPKAEKEQARYEATREQREIEERRKAQGRKHIVQLNTKTRQYEIKFGY